MLPGLRGRLVSEYMVESRVADAMRASDGASARATLSAWRLDRGRLGPASSVRAVFEVAAAPLAQALGFGAPQGVARAGNAVRATFPMTGGAVVLVVAPWGERLDSFWRLAVTDARAAGAAWALACNGTAWRIVDAGRLYARRFLEFDLDLALDDPRTFAALWSVARAAMFVRGAAGTPLHELISAVGPPRRGRLPLPPGRRPRGVDRGVCARSRPPRAVASTTPVSIRRSSSR